MEAENKKLREWIQDRLENSCVGCDYFHYHGTGLAWVCKHPTSGCWLEGDDTGIGCEDHTEIEKILGKG
jgi:hypothetical protein